MVVVAEAEQQERAFNLGLAGLLGNKVFNFGELVSSADRVLFTIVAARKQVSKILKLLYWHSIVNLFFYFMSWSFCIADTILIFMLQLQHPVLDSLQNTSRKWLVDLLYAFNSGDIDKMNELKPFWSSQVQ